MNRQTLSELVDRCFPFIPKPKRHEIPFHTQGCAQCRLTVETLDIYNDEQLPKAAIKQIFDQLCTLSAKATAWVYPSYLRVALQSTEPYDTIPEFLIYNLSPADKHKANTQQRLAMLNKNQIECLIEIMIYWQNTEHWRDYCGDDLKKAVQFLKELTE